MEACWIWSQLAIPIIKLLAFRLKREKPGILTEEEAELMKKRGIKLVSLSLLTSDNLLASIRNL